MARLWIQESGNILYSTYRHNTSTSSVRVQSFKNKIWERNWSGMKLKTICFYNCLGLSSSVILNFQYLGETALRFDVDIWKRGDFNPFFPLSHYKPRDPIERIWTFICFFYFYFILFLLEGEERLGGLYIS